MFENLTEKIVAPHRVKSRPCVESDFDRIRKDAVLMQRILNQDSIGVWKSGHALAHCQITADDPLRFFVTRDGLIVLNPEILRQTKVGVPRPEGCLTFNWPGCKPENTTRSHKCEVKFSILRDDGLEEVSDQFAGLQAQVFQHEIDHFDAVYFYDRAGKELPVKI